MPLNPNDFPDQGGVATLDPSSFPDQVQGSALDPSSFPDQGGTSDTPETDKALIDAIPQTMTPAEEQTAVSQVEKEHPTLTKIAGGAGGAALELASGMIPRTPYQYAAQIFPPIAAYEQAKAITSGDVSSIPLVGRIPEIIKAEQTPAFSKERFATAARTLMDVGILAGAGAPGARAAEVPVETVRPTEGEINAIQPSNAQMETRGITQRFQAGTESNVPPTSYSDYAQREAQGATTGELPQEPVVGAETPPAQEPIVPEGLVRFPNGDVVKMRDEQGNLTDEYKSRSAKETFEATKEQGMLQEAVPEAVAPTTAAPVTSTKNVVTAAEREARGIEPAVQAARRDFGTVWDEAATIEQKDPTVGDRLVESINKNPERPVNDTENALLLRKQIKAQSEFDTAVEAVNSAPNELVRADAQARLQAAREDLYNVYQADVKAGTTLGRGLNARKMLADQQYNLAKMEARRRAANDGRPLTEEQLKETKDLHSKIAELQQKLDATEKIRLQADLDVQFKKILADTQKQARAQARAGGTLVDYLDRQAAKARERIIARRGQLNIGIDPTAIADEAIIGASHIARGLSEFGAWSKQMIADLGERIRPYLQDLWDRAKALHDANARAFAPKKSFKPTGATAEDIARFKRLDVYKVGKIRQTEAIKAKLEAGDYTKAVRQKTVLDRQAVELRAEYQRAKRRFDDVVFKDEMRNRSLPRKFADTFVKLERAMKLSGMTTIGKLGSAAATRIVQTPIERVVQSVIGQLPILRRVHAMAPESGISPRAELKAITTGLVKGAKEIPRLLKGESPAEEVLYGKHYPPSANTVESVLDIPGRVHGAIKSIPKESERVRATEQISQWMQKQGYDLTDPQVQAEIGKQADIASKRAIFMQDNSFSKAWNMFMRSAERGKSAGTYAVAKVGQFLLPIVKVPTNIVGETTVTSPLGLVTATSKLVNVMARGLKTIKPEEANLIMRHYSKGMIGTGLFLTGYFNADKFGGVYQKGDKIKPGALTWGQAKIGGITIPAVFMHMPAFIVMQLGATFRKVSDKRVKGVRQGAGAGAFAAATGLIHDLPFVNQISRLDGFLGEQWEKRKAAGQLLEGSVVPMAIRNVAEWTDPLKEPHYRTPRTLTEYVKMGIPGLRETVPHK